MGKVANSAPAIMAALYGSKGRPETREWREMCAERSVAASDAARQARSLVVTQTITPGPRLVESPRTRSKWAKARARHNVVV